ncbi:dihydrolipoyl dehydrogenase [Heyndrickxia ginsengihumi]|uniref:Dihydrolipoyl dehydrogenase n=1 Tax=Heyndrickxia ginsengihumi TaxID=363870 RepID=A0A0A6Y1F0_9BACI|nr:dihydrolipoyl dehydrogenase [Heyndrickxia ginsengihumi]KHD86127.1 dihydrolipoamide dehydrogenase [Heyndrickxia ginsengihumi]MBE6184947.1 dihydrolipoyl dehydrogenase [Bacillus sp. (in: firmicutes)]NEY21311.1 dihydrolipoyl dehydrogenase [Heyndrickxia ginsengihumi]
MTTIAIIGGGPAGYVAAITAAQQGQEVILIEQRSLGGTCLNTGCMPTKTLLESASMFNQIKHANQFGIQLPVDAVSINWQQVLERKEQIVGKLVQGIQYLMKKNKITIKIGKASFLTNHTVVVENNEQKETVEADQFIIATGSESIPLPFAPFDEKWIISSNQALELPQVPNSLLIVGGGVIGCEFASIYSRMGTKVTIVEMADQILPGEDKDTVAFLHNQLQQDGVTIRTSTAVKELDNINQVALLENEQGKHEVYADYILVAIGRSPRIHDLNLEYIGVEVSKRGIIVNEQMQTTVPNIYACGDVVGGIQLAHVGFHEGEVAASNASGLEAKVNYRAVPRCIYTFPEIASVGMTEKTANEMYPHIKKGEFPFSANGKALIANEQEGKVKVLIDPEYDEIIGISIVGPHATELIGQGTIMLHAELTSDSMDHFIAAHPTLSEAIHEAILNANGQSIHI